MKRIAGLLAAVVSAACGSQGSSDAATEFIQRAIIIAPNDAGADFGCGVALSGDGQTLAIGSSSSGLLYVYVLNGSSWVPQATLSVDAKWGGFGRGFALSEDGSTLAATADFESLDGGDNADGAVYIFQRRGTGWSQQARLPNPAPVTITDNFGRVISLSRDGALLAISGKDTAHLYERISDTWTPQAILPAVGGPVLSGDGTTLVLGAPEPGPGPAALVFSRDGGSWNQRSSVTYPETPAMGGDVVLSRNASTMVLGAVDDEAVGLAYVFEHRGQNWALSGTLTTVAARQGYGSIPVVMNDDASRIVVSMPTAASSTDAGWVGAMWVYTRNDTGWGVQRIDAHDDSLRDFGRHLSLSGDGSTLAVASPPQDFSGRQGEVYVFTTW